MNKVLIVTEVHDTQFNICEFEKLGYSIQFITLADFIILNIPCTKIRFIVNPWHIGRIIEHTFPRFIHIFDGLLSQATIKYCDENDLKFTTSSYIDYNGTDAKFFKDLIRI